MARIGTAEGQTLWQSGRAEEDIHFREGDRHLCLAYGEDVTATTRGFVLLVGCLTSKQHASVSQGRICSDNFTCCHTEIEVADQTFYLTQSQYTDTGPTSPSADPIMPGTWQGSSLECQFLSHWYDSTQKNPGASGIRTLDLPLPRRTP